MFVRQSDSVALRSSNHDTEMVVADLVPEPAGPGVNERGDGVRGEAEPTCGNLIEDLGYVPELDEVIAASDSSQLGATALFRPFAHGAGIAR